MGLRPSGLSFFRLGSLDRFLEKTGKEKERGKEKGNSPIPPLTDVDGNCDHQVHHMLATLDTDGTLA